MASVDDFSVLLTTLHLADLEQATTGLVALLEADGQRASAAIVRRAYARLISQLDAVAREVADKAERYIKEADVRSRLRPAPTGDTGPVLEDFLGRSEPLPAVNGSVGINDEELLYDNVSWWWTQEEGYSGHVGRTITGLFFESGFSSPAAPSPSRSREHPLFAPASAQRDAYASLGFDGGAGPRGGTGRRMTIRNPIPARHFVRDGAARAEAEWHTAVDRARAEFDAEVRRVARA